MVSDSKTSKRLKNIRFHHIEVLGGIGNRNILFSHIESLDEKLESKTPPFDVQNDTDYFCWLLLKSNNITLLVEHKYLRHNKKISPDEHIKLEDMLKFLKKNEYSDTNNFHYLRKVLELRDRLVHLGIPNPIKQLKNEDFISTAINGDYQKIKYVFQKAEGILKEIPDPIVPIGRLGQIGR